MITVKGNISGRMGDNRGDGQTSKTNKKYSIRHDACLEFAAYSVKLQWGSSRIRCELLSLQLKMYYVLCIIKFLSVKISYFVLYRNFLRIYYITECTRWCSWLRHCATRPKIAVSIPDGVI